ncbi:MAG TPA: hypothetical protein PLF59_08260 [Cyclobacteriaceae bacterium]|nr:hypothetical protein [Cyclobacteriaceae bacterium]
MKITIENWTIFFGFKTMYIGFDLKRFRFKQWIYQCYSCCKEYCAEGTCKKCNIYLQKALNFYAEYGNYEKILPHVKAKDKFFDALLRMYPCKICLSVPLHTVDSVCPTCSAALYEKHKHENLMKNLNNPFRKHGTTE